VDSRISGKDGSSTQSVSDPATGLRPGEPRADEAESRDRAARFKEALTQQQQRPDPAREREAAERRAAAQESGRGKESAATDKGTQAKENEGTSRTKAKDGDQAAKEAKDAKEPGAGELAGEGAVAGGLGRRGLRGKHEDGGDPGGDGPGGGLADGLTASEGMASSRRSESDKSEAALIAEQLAAVNVQWSRPEGPARVEAARRRELAGPVDGASPMHKLLIGQGPNGAEARLSITVGPLAGAEIHLRHGPDGLHAVVLTQGASTRQTLASALDEVAKRLRDKGHKIDIKMSQGAAAGQTTGEADEPSLIDDLTGRPRRG
jgi:hypothetical protein